MTRSEWGRSCAVVLALWPAHPWPDSTVEAGWLLCKDLPEGAVKRAIVSLARQGREYPPNPTVVFKYAEAEMPNVVKALPAETELSAEEEAHQRANFQRAMEMIRARNIGGAAVEMHGDALEALADA